MKIVAAVYSHPEYYPPTLNAINILSNHVEKIEIISRNVKEDEIVFPTNVRLRKSGHFKMIRKTETASYFWKLKSFIHFTIKFYKSISKNSPDWVIAYDPIPLLSYRIISFFLLKKPKLWYHNHDVLEISKLKKYSISWFAHKTEQNLFNKIDLFSLPSEEREIFFPINKLKGTYFFLPNYPSIANLSKFFKTLEESKPIKLIYQGHIGEGHGLVEIIDYLKTQTDLLFFLTIIGNFDEHFKNTLEQLINKFNLSDSIKIYPAVPYSKLEKITQSHHIGLAIHEPINLAFKTAATSSNKIYEYVCCGLPVLLYDHITYKQKIGNRDWAFFTDLSYQSIDININNMIENYEKNSKASIKDFEKELNFEHYFSSVISFLLAK